MNRYTITLTRVSDNLKMEIETDAVNDAHAWQIAGKRLAQRMSNSIGEYWLVESVKRQRNLGDFMGRWI